MTPRIEVRPAKPTLEEGKLFAHYMHEASDQLMQTMFGRGYPEVIAKTYLSTGHVMSHETVVFVESEGSVIGMGSWYGSNQGLAPSDRALMGAAGIRLVRAAPFAIMARRLFEFMDTLPDGDFYLAALAIDDNKRGLGIGSRLFDQTESEARASGHTRLVLDVAVDNKRARQLYERHGMSAEAESPAIAFLPNERVYRMVKPL